MYFLLHWLDSQYLVLQTKILNLALNILKQKFYCNVTCGNVIDSKAEETSLIEK